MQDSYLLARIGIDILETIHSGGESCIFLPFDMIPLRTLLEAER